MEVILTSSAPHDVLWPLWHTWTIAICAQSTGSPHHLAWQKAGEQLGLLGPAFAEKIEALDAYLDLVEEVLDDWARKNGG
jgi:hypothetical protein